jgi:hypothetical protein
MSIDLKTLFQKIKIDAQTANFSYVYYDKETGEIHKISPKKEETKYEILELDYLEANPLLTGEKKTSDFKVFYDIVSKTVLLKNINESAALLYDKILYKIPNDESQTDLIIEQNFITKSWNVILKEETLYFVKKHNLSLYDKILLSVTKKDDPNILYRTLYVDLGKLIEKSWSTPFKFDFEFERKEVSIYTNKYFDSYSYKVT